MRRGSGMDLMKKIDAVMSTVARLEALKNQAIELVNWYDSLSLADRQKLQILLNTLGQTQLFEASLETLRQLVQAR